MSYHIVSPELGSTEQIEYNGKKINVIRITIKNEDFDSCIRISKNFDSKNWNESEYRRGFLNNNEDETFDTEEIGTLSEFSVCKIFGLILDGNKKIGGFDYDYKINNKTFDVKGSKCFRGKNYIKAIHETGHKCNLKSDFYFLTYINGEFTNRKEKTVTIDVVGVISKDHVEELKPIPSPTSSKHFNYEIEYDNPNVIPIIRVYERFLNSQDKEGVKQQINGSDFKLLKVK